ncbi:MAG: hypothetical protein ACXW28_01820 [Thermoanaerobaculia bacterium]
MTYAGGRTTDFYSRHIAGQMRTVQIDGSCDCGSEDGVYAWDAAGHFVREQDALGYVRECEDWREDCEGEVGKCLQKNFEDYPIEGYSEVTANLGWPFSGRNSNTFVKCLAKKCGLSAGPRVTGKAPGYNQPCPAGF